MVNLSKKQENTVIGAAVNKKPAVLEELAEQNTQKKCSQTSPNPSTEERWLFTEW